MSFRFQGIDHVQLTCPEGSEERAREFYVRILGWKEIPKPQSLAQRGGVWFLCGAHEVHVGVEDVPANKNTKAHVAFNVSQLESLRRHLYDNCILFIDDEARANEGIRRLYVRDPFGNRLEFTEQR